MGRQTETDPDSTLPHPELNPLVNPLLGENMGRWAEVYFTAAPEHRDEAVQALLQELRSGPTDKPAYSTAQPIAKEPGLSEHGTAEHGAAGRLSPSLGSRPRILPGPDEPEKVPTARIKEDFVACQSCGARAPDVQKFCGMCGASMQDDTSTEAAAGRPEVFMSVPPKWANPNNSDPPEEYHPVDIDRVRDTVFSFGGNVPAADRSVPYRYRIYVGAALLIMIAALVIMGYRSAQNWSGSSHPVPQAAPSAESQPAAQPAAKSGTPDKAPVSNNGRTAAPADRETQPKAEPHENSAPSVQPAQPSASTPAPPSMTPDSSSANQGNGAQELQIAERYLTGAHGNARDSREAARWLWQAVGKQNAAATVMLSDLYLKGDGVPKNCDQARLLLDAAASKGAAGAGERLRNLQAFGCQ